MKSHRTLWTVLGLTFVGFTLGDSPILAQDRGASEGGEDDEQVLAWDAAITVTVENHHWSDMRIYAVRWGIGSASEP